MKSNIPRRILRRRSPPRVVMVSGGKGNKTPQKKVQALKHLSPASEKVVQKGVSQPRVANIIVARKEPLTSTGISQVTTVTDLPQNQTAQRMRVPRKNPQSLQDGSAKMVSVASSTSIAQDNAISTLKQHQLVSSGREVKNIGSKQLLTKSLFSGELEMGPGMTHVWHMSAGGIHPSATENERPKLGFSGDQGLRFTFHRGAGGLIQDIDIPPSHQPSSLTIPPETRIFTVSTLGGAGEISPNITPSFASITSTHSTENRCGVGFQRDSSLTQVGTFTFLCRGGVLATSANNSNNTMRKKSLFRAGDVTEEQNNLKLTLPANLQTIVVISSTKTGVTETLGVEITGVTEKSGATSIQREGMLAHVWTVAGNTDNVPIEVTAQTDDNTSVHSIVGFTTNAESILNELTTASWLNLVEEGPLSSLGRTSLTWTPGEIDELPRAQAVPTKTVIENIAESPPSVVETVEAAIEEIVTEPPSEEQEEGTFTLPDALGTELYQFDLSSFADDLDEEDVLTFSKHQGADWLSINSTGQLSGTPSNEDAGRNRFVFRVSDLEGASSDAVMVINVIKKKVNRAPFWKKELSDSSKRPQWSKLSKDNQSNSAPTHSQAETKGPITQSTPTTPTTIKGDQKHTAPLPSQKVAKNTPVTPNDSTSLSKNAEKGSIRNKRRRRKR